MLLAGTGVPVLAQGESPAELRQQVERLTAENLSLKGELDSLRARLDALVREGEALRRLLVSRGTPAPGPGGAPSEPGSASGGITADPYSSPDALFVALLVDYAEHRAAVPEAGDDAERERRRVRAWTQGVPKRFTGQSNWLTRIELAEDAEARPPRPALVTVLHPATLEAMGEAFFMEIPERFVARMRRPGEQDAPAPESALWELGVQVQARPVFDPGRDRPGPFDYPRLIGPYAGFDFRVEVLSVAALTLEEARKRAEAGRTEAGEPVDR
jgi:hypothetical protein